MGEGGGGGRDAAAALDISASGAVEYAGLVVALVQWLMTLLL